MEEGLFQGLDQYLVGNPQVTHFKKVYRRHTPFETIQTTLEQTVEGNDLVYHIDLTAMHVLNRINLFHFDHDIAKLIESITIEIDGVKIESITGNQIVYEDKLGEPLKHYSRLHTSLLGTFIVPGFWFLRSPIMLCSLKDRAFSVRIRGKRLSPLTAVTVTADGCNLGADEYRRNSVLEQETLVTLHQPALVSLASDAGRFPIEWCPRNHRLFGKDFNSSALTLLCSLRKTHGLIDRNIRERFIREWANKEGALINRFIFPLESWRGSTKWLYFVLFDDKNNRIDDAVLYDSHLINDDTKQKRDARIGESLHHPSFYPDTPYPILSFAISPFCDDPSGHLSEHQSTSLVLHCECRVQRVEVHAFGYGVLEIKDKEVALIFEVK